MWPSKYKYDAFISHAVEDKLPIANELCLRLEREGLKIWYSGKELMPGDSLEKTIQKGLAQSRYGVVVLSHKYLEKNWPMREFYMLLAREIEHRRVILPVLFEITVDELRDKNMAMIDRWSIPFSKGMDHIVDQLISIIKPQGNRRITFWEWVEENFYALKFWFATLLILSLLTFICWNALRQFPSAAFIEHTVDNRIKMLQQELDRDNTLAVSSGTKRLSSINPVASAYNAFMNVKSHYRNEYEFDNGIRTVRGKKNVEEALNIDAIALTPGNTYTLTAPSIFFTARHSVNTTSLANYSFYNTQPVEYTIDDEGFIGEGLYEVTVSFKENVRAITVSLLFPDSSRPLKKHIVMLKGFLPKEKYRFEKKAGEWALKSIE